MSEETPEIKEMAEANADVAPACPGAEEQATSTPDVKQDDGHTAIETDKSDAAFTVAPSREASEGSAFAKVMKRIFIGPTTNDKGEEIEYQKGFYQRRCALWVFGLFNLLGGLVLIIIAAYTKSHYAGLCGSSQYLSISAGIILSAGVLVFLAVRCFQRRSTCFFGTVLLSGVLVAWAVVFLAPILFLRPLMVSDHELELTLTLDHKHELIPTLLKLAGKSGKPARGSEAWDNTAVIIGLAICGVGLISGAILLNFLTPGVMIKYLLWYAPLIAGLFFCVVTWVYLGDGGKIGLTVGIAVATFFALIIALMCHTRQDGHKACSGCAQMGFDVLRDNKFAYEYHTDDCALAFLVPVLLGVPLAVMMLTTYLGEAPTMENLESETFPHVYDWNEKIASSEMWFDTHKLRLVTENFTVDGLSGQERATQLYAMQLVQNGKILKFYVLASFICCALYAIYFIVSFIAKICCRVARGGNQCPKCGETFGSDTPRTCNNCGVGLKWK